MAFFPKPHKLSLTMRKTSEKPNLRDMLQKYLTILQKTMKVRKAKTEKTDQRRLKRHDN